MLVPAAARVQGTNIKISLAQRIHRAEQNLAATVALPTLPRAPVTSTRIDPPDLAHIRWYNMLLSAFHPSGSGVKALHESSRCRATGNIGTSVPGRSKGKA